jgi:tRNA nucleotidyltransferase (CCA-adding enzyme)
MAFLQPLSKKSLNRFIHRYAFYCGDSKRIFSFKKNFLNIEKKLSPNNLTAIRLHSLLYSLSYEVIILTLAMSRDRKVKSRIKEYFLRHHHKKISITGDDLLSLGMKPGPKFRQIFQMVFNKKINGEIDTREEELDFVKKIMNK